MTLREKQCEFSILVARLIAEIYQRGYCCTLGEAYRSPEEAARLAKAGKGIAASLHTQRLAIDLNLFKGDAYLADSEAHKPFGEWWEAQSTNAIQCCWGGRFGDGNHYSVSHGGRR